MWSDEASRFSLRLCVFKAVEVGVNQSVCRKTDGQELGGKGFDLLQGGFQACLTLLAWARRSAAPSKGSCCLWGSAGESRAQVCDVQRNSPS